MYKIILNINPTTKKNSQQIFRNRFTGTPFITQSEKYKLFEKECLWQLKKYKIKTIDYPINLKCLFYRENERKVDLSNLISAISDVLVKAEIIQDDNFKIIKSYDGSRVLIDKTNPRLEIEIEEVNYNK